MEENTELYPGFLITNFTSILLSLFFILILNKKQSNNARIFRHIVMSEGIYTFSLGLVLLKEKSLFFRILNPKISSFLKIITFELDIFNKNFDLLYSSFSLAIYYGSELFSLTLSFFYCLELILILRNPIAQMKSRLKPYFIISYFLFVISTTSIFFLEYQNNISQINNILNFTDIHSLNNTDNNNKTTDSSDHSGSFLFKIPFPV